MPEWSTPTRWITDLQSGGHEDAALLRELQEAFEFLTLMRLDNQLQQARRGEPLSNYITARGSLPICKGTH